LGSPSEAVTTNAAIVAKSEEAQVVQTRYHSLIEGKTNAGLQWLGFKFSEPQWKEIEIQFFHLKYNGLGWDDGMDKASQADRNLLQFFGGLAEVKTAKTVASLPITNLQKYPKGFAPPFVYMTGSEDIHVSPEEVKVLQVYLADGGMLLADCGGPKWDASFRALMQTMFPTEPLRDIPDNDVIYQKPFALANGAPPLWHHGGQRALGIQQGGRWAVFYHPGDLNDAWKTGHSGLAAEKVESAHQLGVNLIYYAYSQAFELAKKNGR